jgi:hypothetical protein
MGYRPSAASVFYTLICVAGMDVGVILLSWFYVPHLYVCVYAVGRVEYVPLISMSISVD